MSDVAKKIEEYIVSRVAKLLSTSPDHLDYDENLLELGFDSTTLVEFAEKFEADIGIKLYPTVFFEFQTLNEILDHFLEEYSTEFSSYFNLQESQVFDTISPLEEDELFELLWVNLNDTNILKKYEIEKSFSVSVQNLNQDRITCSTDKIIFYIDTAEDISIFKIIKFLNENFRSDIKVIKLIIDEKIYNQNKYEIQKFCKNFTEIPFEEFSNVPFQFYVLDKFSIANIKNILDEKDLDFQYSYRDEDIAIIGIDGVFPKSNDLDSYWENLVSQNDMVSEIDEEREEMWKMLADLTGEEYLENGKIYGGFIDDVEMFDHNFFNISAREAQTIDPQQRIFLTSSWKCMQNAGYSMDELNGTSTGVFGAVGTRDYHELSLMYRAEVDPQLSTGLAHSILANRVSYINNFSGPSESIDTACSSSLVALHRAIKSIHNNECEQALVGGVNLNLSPLVFYAFNKTGILSEHGRCRPFDEKANGYARGEGVGTIFIKPIRKAIEDNDYIHGVIKGSAVNHGGKGRSMTAPNPIRQSEVIRKAIETSACDINTISYIEAHGTGTALGDPLEIDGLKKAFVKFRDNERDEIKKPWCSIGSVKGNIGHLETAAGIAGLMKVILSFKHKTIPASIHINNINPLIKLKDTPFSIATSNKKWTNISKSTPLRAGVSSFGFGGTNAHVVLEEFQRDLPEKGNKQQYYFPFSAPSLKQLKIYLEKFLLIFDDYSIADLAFTLQNGRDSYDEKCVFEAYTHHELKASIISFNESTQNLTESPLALSWLEGRKVNWNSTGKRVPIPTFELKKERHWLEVPEKVKIFFSNMKRNKANDFEDSQSSSSSSSSSPPSPSDSIRDYLIEEISILLKSKKEDIDINKPFIDYGLDSILGMSLVKRIEQKLQMPIYVNEIIENDTINKLAKYLSDESNTEIDTFENKKLENNKLKKRIIKSRKPISFILSTPRAGSTLLRSMLMGNSRLFAPPEMHLLNFDIMSDRHSILSQTPLYEGLIETITELKGISIDEAKYFLNELENLNTPTSEVYKEIQEILGNKLLIDKSPSYAQNIETLKNGEDWFENSKYIILLRHPYAVIDSIVKNRFHKMIPTSLNINEATPHKIAENIWKKYNKNILEFKSEISSDKYTVVYYEELVSNTEEVMKSICDFLGVEFEKSMLNPYGNNRMIDGLTSQSISIGDPNFLKHGKIDSNLANKWKDNMEQLPLLDIETIKLATNLGYEVMQNTEVNKIQNLYLEELKSSGWGLSHHFTYKSREELTLEKLRVTIENLILTFEGFHRLLSSDNRSWVWEKDIKKLYEIELLGKVQSGYFETTIKKFKSKINNRVGKNIILSIGKSSSNKYEVILLYNHLLGDGVSSIKLINFITDSLGMNNSDLIKTDKPLSKANALINSLNISDNYIDKNHNIQNGKMVEQTFEAKFLLKDYNRDPFHMFMKCYEDVLFDFIGQDEFLLAFRNHNRQEISDLNINYSTQVSLLAIDIPILVRKETSLSKQIQDNISSREKKVIFRGNHRLNYQPIYKIGLKDGVELIDSKETFTESRTPNYNFDTIIRANQENTNIIIRYNDSTYKNKEITSFGEKLTDAILNFANGLLDVKT